MPRRLSLAGFAGGVLAGTVALRRWADGRRGRVDVYFDDGSFVTFVEGSQQADRLLPLARQVLAATGPT